MVGGSAFYLYQTFKDFSKEEMRVVTYPCEGSKEVDESIPVEVLRLPYLLPNDHPGPVMKQKIHMLRHWIPDTLKMVREENLESLWCGQVDFSGIVGTVAQRFRKIAMGVIVYAEEITTQRRFYYPPLIRHVLRKADLIVSISRYTTDVVAGLGVDREKIRLNPPGADIEHFRPGLDVRELRLRHGIREEEKVLFSVGRLIRRKGFGTVISALPTILREQPNVRYLIGGTGPEREALEKQARELGVAERIEFLGFVSPEDLPLYYNLADVFLFPNFELAEDHDTEGFGIVFIEANACGTPVIGGNAGGAPEAVEDGVSGFVVDGTDPAAVADKILLLMRDQDLARKLGEQGRKRVERDFTWDAARAKMIEANRELMDIAKARKKKTSAHQNR